MTPIQAKGSRSIQASSRAIQAFGGETVIVGGAEFVDWDAAKAGFTNANSMLHALNSTIRETHSTVGFIDPAGTIIRDDNFVAPNVITVRDQNQNTGCGLPAPTGWQVLLSSITGRLSWSIWPLVDAENPLGIRPDRIRMPLFVSAFRSVAIAHAAEWCATWPDTPNDSDVLFCFGGQKAKPEYFTGLFAQVGDNYVCEPFNRFPFPPDPISAIAQTWGKVLFIEVDAPELYDPATTSGPEDLTLNQIVFFHQFVELNLSQAILDIWNPDPGGGLPPLGFVNHRRLDIFGGSGNPGQGPDFVEYIYL